MLTRTQPMTIRDIGQALNLTNREVSSLRSCIAKMIELDSLRWDSNNCLEVINFEKRQGRPQSIDERELRVRQQEETVKEMLVQRLWANEWQPTGEEIVLVESEKRIGNLYLDILARTRTGSLILIEVKPFSLQINHLGQVSRYITALKMQNSLPVFAFLIGRDRQNITDTMAKSAGITILAYDELPFEVGSSVKPTVNSTLNQHYKKEEEGRGEIKKKEYTSPSGEVYSPKTPDEIKMLFDLWNSLGVIKHRKLTGQVMRAVKATLRDFSAAEVSQAMKNYALILNDERCFFKYRWTLKDFLKRGLEKFLDLEVAWKNYRREGTHGFDKRHSEQTKPEKWDCDRPIRPDSGNLGNWTAAAPLR